MFDSRITPKQMGTDLNPTENTFGRDPEKMSNEGQNVSLLDICAPKPCRRRVPPALPRPHWFQHVPVLVKEGASNSHVRGQDFIPKGRRGYLTSLSEDVSPFYILRVRRILRASAPEPAAHSERAYFAHTRKARCVYATGFSCVRKHSRGAGVREGAACVSLLRITGICGGRECFCRRFSAALLQEQALLRAIFAVHLCIFAN